MRVCVYGLGHLGSVTAACLAEHFETVGCDPDLELVFGMKNGKPPVFEPGLSELVLSGVASGRLSFAGDPADALAGSEIVWVAFDTPVDENDVANSDFVTRRMEVLFPHLEDKALILISSQVPAGFTSSIESAFRSGYAGKEVSFAYSPENLRLGRALDAFREPERIIAGTSDERSRERLALLFSPFCRRVEWMSVESAEMTKHALNAFLATSVAFINEIAALCERMKADVKEVERGLKSDPRIGQRAYLRPGGPYSGGTLARDVSYLNNFGERANIPLPLIAGVRASNDAHKGWLRRKVEEFIGEVSGKTFGVLGLTYKPDTDTLRRSDSVEFCRWLGGLGAFVRAHDPMVNRIAPELSRYIDLRGDATEVWRDADALIIATEWPEFRSIAPADLVSEMRAPIVIDPNQLLVETMGGEPSITYITVGDPGKEN